jgi:lysophospholipase L1-like esterase
MTGTRILMTMATLMAMGASATAELKDGETIVFLGDSITQQGAGPTGYVTVFREAIEKARPNSGIKVIGAGIGGHKVPDLEARLDKDVLSHKPNVVVIYIGINDVWHSKNGRGTPVEKYDAGLRISSNDALMRAQESSCQLRVLLAKSMMAQMNSTKCCLSTQTSAAR